MAQKIPPHNLEAETRLLGALLLDKDAVIKVADKVRIDDFYSQKHGDIYSIMLALFDERQPIDVLSVTNRLKERKLLDTIGGTSFVTNLTDQVGSSSHVVHYAEIIAKTATLRKLEQAASEIIEFSYMEDQPVDDLLDRAEQKLFNVSQKYLRQNFIPIKSVLTETFDRIDELHREGGKIRGLPTGFVD